MYRRKADGGSSVPSCSCSQRRRRARLPTQPQRVKAAAMRAGGYRHQRGKRQRERLQTAGETRPSGAELHQHFRPLTSGVL